MKRCPHCRQAIRAKPLRKSRLEPNEIDGMSMVRVYYVRKSPRHPWVRELRK